MQVKYDRRLRRFAQRVLDDDTPLALMLDERIAVRESCPVLSALRLGATDAEIAAMLDVNHITVTAELVSAIRAGAKDAVGEQVYSVTMPIDSHPELVKYAVKHGLHRRGVTFTYTTSLFYDSFTFAVCDPTHDMLWWATVTLG